jgi:cell division septum initiation protein DivIVA
MSITNNIDGSSGSSNQLLELLSVVSNPKVYEAKVKSLQEATDENKKYVELVGPASEIIELREKAKADAAKAEKLLEDAKAQALQIVNDGQRKSDGLVSEAKAQAQKLKNEADGLIEVAKQKSADASLAETKANAAKVELEKTLVAVEKQLAEAEDAKKAALEAERKFNKAYDNIIAKHKAFIESL